MINFDPKSLADITGQDSVKRRLRTYIESAKARNARLPHILLVGNAGLGKCVGKDTLIFTKKGLIPIENFSSKKSIEKLNLKIQGKDSIVETSYITYEGIQKVIHLETRWGYKLTGTYEHPILTLTPEGEIQFKNLENFKEGDIVCIQRNQQFFGSATNLPKFKLVLNNRQTNVNDFKIPLKMTKEFARILGYLVAEGYTVHPRVISFTNTDPEIIEDFNQCARKCFGVSFRKPHPTRLDYVLNSLKVRKFLGICGINYGKSKDKEIPWIILQSPKEFIVEYLKAYFEGDGCPLFDRVEVTTSSEKMSEQLQVLLLNFGITCRRHRTMSKATNGLNIKRPYWRIEIFGENLDIFNKEINFISKRKIINLQKASYKKRNTNIDVIPYISDRLNKLSLELCCVLIKELKTARGIFKKQRFVLGNNLYSRFLEIIIKNKASYSFLSELLTKVKSRIKSTSIYSQLEYIKEKHFLFVPVKSISFGKETVYDFVVPQTHSFTSNGFISHNTTIAKVLAHERGVPYVSAFAPTVKDIVDMASQIKSEANTVFFIDEIHALPRDIEESFYSLMDAHRIYHKGKWREEEDITIVGATTMEGLLSKPFRSRFIVEHLTFNTVKEMETILKIYLRSEELVPLKFTEEAINAIAIRSRGTPRVAKLLLERVVDYVITEKIQSIDKDIVEEAFEVFEIDQMGLGCVDRKILNSIADSFGGGPVGINTLASALFEEPTTLELDYEPYLVYIGFVIRTSRGRVLSESAWKYLKKKPIKQIDLDPLLEEPISISKENYR